jgi:hypothetical protein
MEAQSTRWLTFRIGLVFSCSPRQRLSRIDGPLFKESGCLVKCTYDCESPKSFRRRSDDAVQQLETPTGAFHLRTPALRSPRAPRHRPPGPIANPFACARAHCAIFSRVERVPVRPGHATGTCTCAGSTRVHVSPFRRQQAHAGASAGQPTPAPRALECEGSAAGGEKNAASATAASPHGRAVPDHDPWAWPPAGGSPPLGTPVLAVLHTRPYAEWLNVEAVRHTTWIGLARLRILNQEPHEVTSQFKFYEELMSWERFPYKFRNAVFNSIFEDVKMLVGLYAPR